MTASSFLVGCQASPVAAPGSSRFSRHARSFTSHTTTAWSWPALTRYRPAVPAVLAVLLVPSCCAERERGGRWTRRAAAGACGEHGLREQGLPPPHTTPKRPTPWPSHTHTPRHYRHLPRLPRRPASPFLLNASRLTSAVCCPPREKAASQLMRSYSTTSWSVPGAASRLPPSGCQAAWLRLVEARSSCACQGTGGGRVVRCGWVRWRVRVGGLLLLPLPLSLAAGKPCLQL